MQRAKDAFSRGQSHYDVGEFNEAREAFQLSFDAFPHFRTIFNLALCEEKLGNVAAAVELYHRYLNWSGDVPARDDVEKKLEKLQALLPPEPEPEPEPSPTSEVEKGPDLIVPGWITLGSGAAVTILGGVMLGLAASKKGEIEDVQDVAYDPDKHDQMIADGERYEDIGWLVGGIGVAAMGAGLVMLLVSDWDEEEQDETGPTVDVGILDNGAVVGASWCF